MKPGLDEEWLSFRLGPSLFALSLATFFGDNPTLDMTAKDVAPGQAPVRDK
ncbi:MAG: hypothetical protein ACLQVN_00365 [Bryobacteraceae bacterium]